MYDCPLRQGVAVDKMSADQMSVDQFSRNLHADRGQGGQLDQCTISTHSICRPIHCLTKYYCVVRALTRTLTYGEITFRIRIGFASCLIAVHLLLYYHDDDITL